MKDVVEMMALSDQWYVHPDRRSNDTPKRRVHTQRNILTGHGCTPEDAWNALGMVHSELSDMMEEMTKDMPKEIDRG